MRNEEFNPHKDIVEVLLMKLGLPKEYAQQLFFVSKREEKEQLDKFLATKKYGLKSDLRRRLEELEDVIDFSISYNKLELEWHKIWTDYREEKIDKAEGARRIKGLIEKCFPWECLEDNRKNYYYSYRELQYMCGYLILENPTERDYGMVLHRLEDYCNEKLGTIQEINCASALLTILDRIQSIYGNRGEFKCSNRYCRDALRVAYIIENSYGIEDTLYALWWNEGEETKTTDLDMLSWLVDFANLIGDVKGEAFMKEKLAKSR